MKKFKEGQLIYFTRDIKSLVGREVIIPANKPVLIMEIKSYYAKKDDPKHYRIVVKYNGLVKELRFIPERMRHYKKAMGNLLYGYSRSNRTNK